MSDQKEMLWRGDRIIQVDYTVQPFNKCDAFGFTVEKAFIVRDDMDEPCLPIAQQWFWSPSEAIAAIEMRDVIAPGLRGPKWPTTVAYEYNIMTLYRRNFDMVYRAIQQIRKAIKDASDFDENPAKEITNILNMLHQNMHERRAG